MVDRSRLFLLAAVLLSCSLAPKVLNAAPESHGGGGGPHPHIGGPGRGGPHMGGPGREGPHRGFADRRRFGGPRERFYPPPYEYGYAGSCAVPPYYRQGGYCPAPPYAPPGLSLTIPLP